MYTTIEKTLGIDCNTVPNTWELTGGSNEFTFHVLDAYRGRNWVLHHSHLALAPGSPAKNAITLLSKRTTLNSSDQSRQLAFADSLIASIICLCASSGLPAERNARHRLWWAVGHKDSRFQPKSAVKLSYMKWMVFNEKVLELTVSVKWSVPSS